MKADLPSALAQCLTRLEAGEEIDVCLRDFPDQAERLRPLLESVAAVRCLSIEPYSPAGHDAGRARMRAALARRRRPGLAASWQRSAAVFATAAVVALVALIAVSTDLFRFGSGTSEAHVEGVLSAIRDGRLEIETAEGRLSIGFDERTQVVDPQGQAQNPAQLAPGGGVRIEIEEEDGNLTALRVEVEDEDDEHEGPKPNATPPPAVEVEFDGTITAVSGQDVTVQAPFGSALVHLTTQTEIKGDLAQGALVKVHATRQSDGSYLAREIEVTDAPGGDGDDHSGPGGGDDHSGGGDGESDSDDGAEESGH